jgi:hypothetical protein
MKLEELARAYRSRVELEQEAEQKRLTSPVT